MTLRWYWFHFRSRQLPVTVHLDDGDRRYGWRRIYGVEIGRWFFGIIVGDDCSQSEADKQGL